MRIFLMLLCAIISCFMWPQSVLAQELSSTSILAQSNNFFAMDLYARLKGQPGNLFLSPYSVSTALAMTHAGASGNTAREMEQVLRIMLEPDLWDQAFLEYRTMLDGAQGQEFVVANSLWGQTGQVFIPEFLARIKEYHAAELDQVDFSKPAVAVGRINTWVEDKTRGKIQTILMPENVNSTTRLVLVNAVYFKGNWAKPFQKIHTQNHRFRLSTGQEKVVPTMNQVEHFLYMEDDLVQVVELSYAGEDLSMVIFLPKERRGLEGQAVVSTVEDALNSDRYKSWLLKLTDTEVDLTLPKFKSMAQFSLAQVLSDMGMPDAFSSSADFSGMSDEGELFISDVIHKACVNVGEEGTEAAAVTAVAMQENAIVFDTPSTSAVVVMVDHPFFFVIRDRSSNSILFMGRVMDPQVGGRPVSEVLGGMWSEVVSQALQSQIKNKPQPPVVGEDEK